MPAGKPLSKQCPTLEDTLRHLSTRHAAAPHPDIRIQPTTAVTPDATRANPGGGPRPARPASVYVGFADGGGGATDA